MIAQQYCPTRNSMILTTSIYIDSSRTTSSDIVCTINTYHEYTENTMVISKKLRASLPYNKKIDEILTGRNPTQYQKRMISDANKVLGEDLKLEKNQYYENLRIKQAEVESVKNYCATKIQALFRGYLCRPKSTYKQIRKSALKFSVSELHDELCNYASALNLKPITGLSLESHHKTSRRRRKIEAAAAFRIQRFFSMIVARKKCCDILNRMRSDQFIRASRAIIKAFRVFKLKKLFIRRREQIRQASIVKLQSVCRSFTTRLR